MSSVLAKINKLCFLKALITDDLDFKAIVDETFLKWQLEAGERKTLKQFAEDLLGVHEVTFNRVYNGHRP